jgi:hypothetical protein
MLAHLTDKNAAKSRPDQLDGIKKEQDIDGKSTGNLDIREIHKHTAINAVV